MVKKSVDDWQDFNGGYMAVNRNDGEMAVNYKSLRMRITEDPLARYRANHER